MKLFISADIEGCCGVTHWDEARLGHSEWQEARRQMNAETGAACLGALEAGVSEILVKDAHGTGRNLLGSELPQSCRLVRAWSGDPLSMVTGLDESFDLAIFVGYHARASAGGNPLAHTLSSSRIFEIRLNGVSASEFRIHCFAAASLGVPVVLVSGDAEICREVKGFRSSIHTVATKECYGAASINEHPEAVVAKIHETAREAITDELARIPARLPSEWRLEVIYKEQKEAYRSGFYPGARLESPHLVSFESKDYYEILRALGFLT